MTDCIPYAASPWPIRFTTGSFAFYLPSPLFHLHTPSSVSMSLFFFFSVDAFGGFVMYFLDSA